MNAIKKLACALVLCVACAKKTPAPSPVPDWLPIDEVGIGQVKITPGAWSAEFETETDDWVLRKPGGEGPWLGGGSVVRLEIPPFDAPHGAAAFAEKLKQDDWISLGARYVEITRTTELPRNGFLIEGKVIATIRETKSPPLLAFAMVFDVQGRKVMCHSEQLVAEADRAEAIAMCQTAK